MMKEAAPRLSNQAPAMTMVQMIEAIAREAFEAGDFESALAAAKEILPYTAPRLAPVQAIDPNAARAEEIGWDTDPEIAE